MAMTKIGWLLLLLVALALGFVLIAILGYARRWHWTGLPEYPSDKDIDRRGVTFWAWLSILIVPTSVGLATFGFTYFQHLNDINIETKRAKAATAIEDQRAKAAALREYLDKMQVLLVDNDLSTKTNQDTLSTVAQAHTLAVLEVVGPKYKGVAIRFLYEADLINRSNPSEKDCAYNDQTPVIRLDYARLEGVDLAHRYLANSCLENLYMENAKLSGAALAGASFDISVLRGADLTNANLGPAETSWGRYRSVLTYTDLRDAKLQNVELQDAIMTGAHLQDANLQDADLHSSDLRDADLAHANFRGAILKDTQLHGTDLREVRNLQQKQIEQAHGDRHTKLPEHLRKPEAWIE